MDGVVTKGGSILKAIEDRGTSRNMPTMAKPLALCGESRKA